MPENHDLLKIRPKPAFEAIKQASLRKAADNRDLLRRFHLGGEPFSPEEQRQVNKAREDLKYTLLGDEYWEALGLTAEERKKLGLDKKV